VEIVLKITDNGVTVKEPYIYLTICLLPVNHNAPLHFFGPNCNIKFIQPVQQNKSVAPSNEALIKSRNKLPSFVIPFRINPPVREFFSKENNLSITLNAIATSLVTLL